MKYLLIIVIASMMLFAACTPSELEEIIPDVPEPVEEQEDPVEEQEDPVGEDDDIISGIVDENENIDIGDMI